MKQSSFLRITILFLWIFLIGTLVACQYGNIAKESLPSDAPGTEAPTPSPVKGGATPTPSATKAPGKTTPAPNTPTPTLAPVEKPTASPSPSNSNVVKPPVPSAQNSTFEARVLELVNEERKRTGASPLTMDTQLSNIARVKSLDMQQNGYFSHTSPSYGSVADLLKLFGISFEAAGENLAHGYSTPETVVEGWLNSESHRSNILSSNYRKIGVGYIEEGHHWTQIFTN